MKHFYGIAYTENSLNDSAEKIRAWGTAAIKRFDSKAARAAWEQEHPYHYPCSAAYAHKCGWQPYMAFDS